MSGDALATILNLAFDALDAGLRREALIEQVHQMEASGATPEEIADALRAQRDAALQGALDA